MLIAARESFAAASRRRLPYDAEVEYLESTGTQWIGTDYSPVSTRGNMVIELGVRWAGVSARQLFGADGGYYFGVVNGYWQIGQTGANHSPIGASANTWYNARFETTATAAELTVGGITSTFARTFVNTGLRRVTLFGLGVYSVAEKAESASFLSSCRVRACKIYENGVLLRDFIPVRVGTVGYLYDKANPTGGPNGNGLYDNNGTGAFGVGPDINPDNN